MKLCRAVSHAIYDYEDYKAFLRHCIMAKPNGGRGQRKALAISVGCQISHVTHVLSGAGHFSTEQAEGVARYFGLDFDETEYLLLLVQLARAGTKTLRRFLEKLVKGKRKKRLLLKSRLQMPQSLPVENEVYYYSSWHVSAIHVALSVSELQTREALSHYFKIPISRVDEILHFLIRADLARKDGVRFTQSTAFLHLDKDSPSITKHHTNWRVRAIASMDLAVSEDLHYSSVVSLSKEDYAKVRAILVDALSQSVGVIKASPEERLAAVCVDLFDV